MNPRSEKYLACAEFSELRADLCGDRSAAPDEWVTKKVKKSVD